MMVLQMFLFYFGITVVVYAAVMWVDRYLVPVFDSWGMRVSLKALAWLKAFEMKQQGVVIYYPPGKEIVR